MPTSPTRLQTLEDAALLLLVCKGAALAVVHQDFNPYTLAWAWYASAALYAGAAWACDRAAGAQPWTGVLPRAVLASIALAALYLGLALLDFQAAQPPIGGLDWLLLGLCAFVRSTRVHRPCSA